MKWNILNERRDKQYGTREIINLLFENRGIKTEKERQEFLNPTKPSALSLKTLKIARTEVDKAVGRVRKAFDQKEKVIIYGDYDADGICATAILWEALYSQGLDVLPYIPDRFSEGYGLNPESLKKLKNLSPKLKLVITVDNGIVAHGALEAAADLGIEVIVTDHHQKDEKELRAYAVVHTTEISGSAVAWLLAHEFVNSQQSIVNGLDLVAIGTIADLLPLIGANRSLVKWGLSELAKTRRLGLLALANESAVDLKRVGNYEVGFIIAPRLNAMGRLRHAMDSLRLICTKSPIQAEEIARRLGAVNSERQKIVEKVVLHARQEVENGSLGNTILVGDESYHEGVIGLAASRLVDEFYRPAIVFSRGREFSKASARSIKGFNMIGAIRELVQYYEEGGGHEMAAGFTIRTEKIADFSKAFDDLAASVLSNELLEKSLRIDLEIDFNQLNWDLYEELRSFEPTGVGNPTPSFATKGISVLDARLVGQDQNHLKLSLMQSGKSFAAIGFNLANIFPKLQKTSILDAAFVVEENIWNGKRSLQLKLRDIITK